MPIPTPVNEPVRDYAPGQRRARLAPGPARRAMRGRGRRDPAASSAARTSHRATCARRACRTTATRELATLARGRRARDAPGHRRGAGGAARVGARGRSSSARPSSCARPTCWPARGATRINAATMLGQSKTVHQAEIDAACELIDFLRFNARFAQRHRGGAADQPPGRAQPPRVPPARGLRASPSRPFNFTAIGGNLPTRAGAAWATPCVWKPASTAVLSAYFVMQPAARRPACPTA